MVKGNRTDKNERRAHGFLIVNVATAIGGRANDEAGRQNAYVGAEAIGLGSPSPTRVPR